MLFTAKKLYQDFVLDDENGLKVFYQHCTKRQKAFCWASLAVAILLVMLSLAMARYLTALQNLAALSVLLLAIVVFEGSRERIERKLRNWNKTYTFILAMMVGICAVATGLGIVLMIQLYQMS